MTRHIVFLLIGAIFTVIGSTVLAVFLRVLTAGGLGELSPMVLIPAVFAVLGIVLVVMAIRGMLRHRERRAMPLAVVRAEPPGARSGRWDLDDVASGIARRLVGSPCAVHHAGERIEIRWAGEVAQHRCELRDAGEGVLSHSDVIESALEVLRLHKGVTFRAGPSRSRSSRRSLVQGSGGAFDSVDRRAVHTALDETLALAGWRREG
jgi:hypothetical protein